MTGLVRVIGIDCSSTYCKWLSTFRLRIFIYLLFLIAISMFKQLTIIQGYIMVNTQELIKHYLKNTKPTKCKTSYKDKPLSYKTIQKMIKG